MRNVISVLLGMLTAIIAAIIAVPPATAGTNGLDARFGISGFVALGPTPTSAISIQRLRALAVQDDGKILIGGSGFDPADPDGFAGVPFVGRLNADGNWDTDFGDHGALALPFGIASAPFGGEIHEITVLSDHSIVAAGGSYYNGFDFNTCTLLIKLSDTGSLIATFGPDDSGTFCFDFAPDTSHFDWPFHYEGLLLGSGDSLYLTTPYTNLNHGAVAHFDSNGALVSGYGSNGIAALPESVVADRLQLTTANEILAMGAINNAAAIAVVQLDDTGQIDSGYGTDGLSVFDEQAGGLVSPSNAALDAQQRLVIADNDDNGGLLPYRFIRLTDTGSLDADFNGSAQQPGFPGLAAPYLTDDGYFNGLLGTIPLIDGHLFAVGDAGSAAAGDGATNLALLRLNDDSSFDITFGDAIHPGWASLNIGGTANGQTIVRAFATHSSGSVFLAIDASNSGSNGCVGIVRLVADRLLDDSFDTAPAVPTCP